MFEVTNTSDEPIRLRAVGTVRVEDAEGHVLTDSIRGVGLGTGELTVPAGGSKTLPTADVQVLWPGPVTVTPRCGGRDTLPSLTVERRGLGADAER